jgi:hypothetical protein
MFEKIYAAEPFPKTPFIHFDSQTGYFELKGRSLPENAVQFYLPLFIWLEHYMENPAPKTTLNVQLDYFNSNSAKCIVELFKKMEKMSNSGKSTAIINWLYFSHDEDMQETGENFKSFIESEFNLISVDKK